MKLILTSFFSIYLFVCEAQAVFSFESLKQKDSAVVYRGFENFITLRNIQITEQSNIVVKAVHGRITQSKGGFIYNFLPLEENIDTDTITIIADGKVVGQKVVSVIKMIDPEIHLAGSNDVKVKKEFLLAAPYLVVVYPGSLMNAYDVVSRIDITAKFGSEIEIYKVTGNYFPDELMKLISTYKGKATLICNIQFHGLGCARNVEKIYEVQ